MDLKKLLLAIGIGYFVLLHLIAGFVVWKGELSSTAGEVKIEFKNNS